MMKILSIAAVLLSAAPLLAHPGRLDQNGCHRVTEDWVYKSGEVLKAGTSHCHRGFGALRLDGKELLEDPDDRGESLREKRRYERRERSAE